MKKIIRLFNCSWDCNWMYCFGTSLFMGKYNTVVSLEEQVNESYSNIEIQEKDVLI